MPPLCGDKRLRRDNTSLLFAPRFRRAPSEKAVIRFCCRLYLLLSHILGVSLPPSACSNPLCRHPPPSSEGGEGAPAPRTEINCFGKEDSNERNPSGVSFVFIQVAFALQRRGEGAPAPCTEFAKARAAVKPAGGGLPSSVTVRRSSAPCHLPQGGRLSAPSPCSTRAQTKNPVLKKSI